ncbi:MULTISPECIES: ABC transporter permease [Cetobacterium]|uniref:ABC transporter permease subunit n=1 Tax=Candidatus Cetobacterium colombiensis TaxID=3073100 RepID=A0ABU4W769_9FUSO|nr:ABC transporter permease subunit [Candidatus Cetobacterium colombiensis]MDX8335371.1 ABC transporter permease subunit [Candidatus Cetobacterium colombiensis]
MEKIKKFIYIIPFLLYMTFFFLYGLYYVLMTSLGYNRILTESCFTLDYYKEVLCSKEFYASLIYTIKINSIASFIAFILTVIVLFLVFFSKRKGYFYTKSFQKVIEAPVFVPYLVSSYGVLLLLMRRGVINNILLKLGLISSIDQFPILTNDHNGIGIIFTYVWKALPFMTMMSLPVVFRVDKKWDSLGKIYNLSDIAFFKKIIFPLVFPSLSISFFIVLTYLFASFETPYILGVTHPRVLAVMVFDMYAKGSLDLRGKIMVMNILISAISLLFGGVMCLALRFFTKFQEREW